VNRSIVLQPIDLRQNIAKFRNYCFCDLKMKDSMKINVFRNVILAGSISLSALRYPRPFNICLPLSRSAAQTDDDDLDDLDPSCEGFVFILFIYQEAATKQEPAKRQMPENKMRPVKLPFSLSTRAPYPKQSSQ
jgi:hypothetical protein